MRNPLDSWEKTDSYPVDTTEFAIGQTDLDLAQRLINAGSEHRKFMRQIFVSVDLTAPRYFWSEYDTYKVGTVANSCSTMHRGAAYQFAPEMFGFDDDLDDDDIAAIDMILTYLNSQREKYQGSKNTKYLRRIKQFLPESFLQKRTVTFNYENCLQWIRQRSNHRLTEWSDEFMNFLKTLPHAEELLFYDK